MTMIFEEDIKIILTIEKFEQGDFDIYSGPYSEPSLFEGTFEIDSQQQLTKEEIENVIANKFLNVHVSYPEPCIGSFNETYEKNEPIDVLEPECVYVKVGPGNRVKILS